MNQRIINLEKKGIDQTLRDLINNLGLNASYDICVSQIMKDHQPKSVKELTALCDNTGMVPLE